MAKGKGGGTAAPAEKAVGDRVKLVEEAAAAMRELIARVPRGCDYAVEPALTFDPLQGRKSGKPGR